MKTQLHPVLALADALDVALKDVADLDPVFMRTGEKERALTRLTALGGRLEELRLRVLAAADDVAAVRIRLLTLSSTKAD